MDKVKLLIVGASNKSTRSIARSLQKHNCEIYVLNDVDLAVSKSKYILKYLLKPNVNESILVFKNEILNVVSEYKIDVVLPTTDVALDVVLNFREEIESKVKVIGLNEKETYKYAHNKYELVKKAEQIGLKGPKYLYVDNLNYNADKIAALTYPVVIKPVSSAQIIGNDHYGYKVSVAKNKEELIDGLRELIPSTPVMLQEFIEGFGIGFNVFCIDGEVKSEFLHQRLNENAGVSSYRKIIPIDTFGVKEKVHQLLKEIKWNGVAMVEFKVDATGTPYLMEMNGRFFGSTELGVKAGYDLPSFLFTTQYLKKPEIVNNTGKFYSLRLLHDEVLLESAKFFKTFNIFAILKWKLSLLNLLSPNNFLEDSFFNDPSFVWNLYKYDLKRISRKRKKKKEIDSLPIRSITDSEMSKARNIVFVCKGNICRSPFAELYAKKVFSDKNVISVGTFKLQNRLSPVNAVEAANKLGIDLESHRSKYIDKNNSQVDAFIVMDKINCYELMELGITKDKIYFLGNAEIKDPYKKPIFDFEKTYTEIKENIDRLK